MDKIVKKQKKAAAIHDISCVGRCSLTVALPILSAAGINTGVLPTAVLSTHTGGFTGFTYRDLTEDIEPIRKHWQSLSLQFDALYSGFLGSSAQIGLVADLFDAFDGGDTVILVDPAMADNGKLYSVYTEEMITGMAELCKKGTIVVPNMTEAAFMLGKEYKEGPYTKEEIEGLLKELGDLSKDMVVLTGVYFDENELGAAFYSKKTGEAVYCLSEKILGDFHGTGDVLASALLAGILNDHTPEEAVRLAVDYTCECIRLTVLEGQEKRYGVCFENAIPMFLKRLGLLI